MVGWVGLERLVMVGDVFVSAGFFEGFGGFLEGKGGVEIG